MPQGTSTGVTGGSGGGIPEAPIDGKTYGRKDASWIEVISSGYPYTVGPAITNAQFTTIQAAIDAAELAGGPAAILIYADVYTETVTISKPGINLAGFTGRANLQTELVGVLTVSSDAVTRMTIQGLSHKGRLIIAGTQDTVIFANDYEVTAAHATEGVVHMTNSSSNTTFVPSSTCRFTNSGAGPAITATSGSRLDAEGCRINASSFVRAIDSNGDILLNNCTCQGAVRYTGNGAFKVIITGGATDITSSGFCVDLSSAGGAASALVVNAYLVNLLNTKVLNGSGTNITYGGITIPDGFGTLNSTHGNQIRHDGVKVLNDTGSLTGLLGNLGDYESAADIRTFLNVANGANNYTHPNHTGDVASIGDGATTIQPDAVSNTKLANMPSLTIKGNDTGGVADPKDLTAEEVRVLLGTAPGQSITGLGFSPSFVRIYESVTTDNTTVDVIETSTTVIADNVAGQAVVISNGKTRVGSITSLDADGFTVDGRGGPAGGDHPNKLGQLYRYIAFGVS
jgi:hypothetical protein